MFICLSEEGKTKISEGLALYKSLKRMLDKCKEKAILCETFQKTYDRFYQIRRKDGWRAQYFKYMYECFGNCPSFEDALNKLSSFKGDKSRVEPSFTSKLLHTLNDNLPIWDSIVTDFLERENVIVKPKRGDKDYEQNCVNTYETLIKWYKGDEAKAYAAYFDTLFPGEPISDTKKIDFILWAQGVKNEDPCSYCTLK